MNLKTWLTHATYLFTVIQTSLITNINLLRRDGNNIKFKLKANTCMLKRNPKIINKKKMMYKIPKE